MIRCHNCGREIYMAEPWRKFCGKNCAALGARGPRSSTACVCGHAVSNHVNYERGRPSICGGCDCERYTLATRVG